MLVTAAELLGVQPLAPDKLASNTTIKQFNSDTVKNKERVIYIYIAQTVTQY